VRAARFRVVGRLDMASRTSAGTVRVYRGVDLFEVRPLRRKRTYCLPLSEVARMVVLAVTRAELREARNAKRGGRR